MFLRSMMAAAVAACLSMPAFAQDAPIMVMDAYARTMGGIGKSGAVFFMMHNMSGADDVLVGAKSDVAEMVELHTHIEDANGVMQMVQIEGGIALPADGMAELKRGADHVMLMGLTRELKDGDVIDLTLQFQNAGEVAIQATVDNARGQNGEGEMGDMDHSENPPMGQAGHDHSQMQGHGDAGGHMDHSKMVDQTGMADADAVAAVMKAQFDTPENPLTVDPVVVEGDYALASWAQGDKGGRALLKKGHMGWEIVMCGGADLRIPAFLGEHGVTGAEKLSEMFNAAEDALGEDKVALSSSFEGIVMISGE